MVLRKCLPSFGSQGLDGQHGCCDRLCQILLLSFTEVPATPLLPNPGVDNSAGVVSQALSSICFMIYGFRHDIATYRRDSVRSGNFHDCLHCWNRSTVRGVLASRD